MDKPHLTRVVVFIFAAFLAPMAQAGDAPDGDETVLPTNAPNDLPNSTDTLSDVVETLPGITVTADRYDTQAQINSMALV